MQTNREIELAERYINSTNVSVFLTGKAGTGKTTFLRHIYHSVNKRAVILAPTGVAAVNAGGVTIHSFFQLPFCPYLPDVPELITEYQMPESKRQLRKEKLRIIRTLELLIIDEISMVRADLLDAVDDALRRFRRNSRPFGGVQLLLIGDVQQLPPVVTDSEKPFMDKVYPSPFFFHSKALQRLNYITIELKKIYRQQDDTFVSLLNKIRDNQFDQQTLQALNSRYTPNPSAEGRGRQTIRLTTHNYQADTINQKHLAELPDASVTFEAEIEGNFPESAAPTDMELQLKPGAQVMFVKNDSMGGRYFNGKIGTVQKFEKDDEEGLKIVVLDEEGNRIYVGHEVWENLKYEVDPEDNQIKQKVDGTFSQYPLRLAWAVTIHKAQGLTFDRVIIDAAQAFTYGQVYVALSRCRTLEGLQLSSPISAHAAFDNSDVMGFVNSYTPVEEAESRLPQLMVQYYFDLLFELFDFTSIERPISKINRLYHGHLKRSFPDKVTQISDLYLHQVLDVVSVAEKFRNQIIRISQTPNAQPPSENIPNKAYLDERIAKAVTYFLTQLEEISAKMKPLTSISINNKDVSSDFASEVEQLTEAFKIKMACLKEVKEEGYTVLGYLKAKVDSLLDQDKPKKVKEKKKRGLSALLASKKEKPTWMLSAELFAQDKSIKEVARERGCTPTTVENHLFKAIEEGKMTYEYLTERMGSQKAIDDIMEYMASEHPSTKKQVYEYFDGKYDYIQIRIAQGLLNNFS